MKHSFYILLFLLLNICSVDTKAEVFVKVSSLSELTAGTKIVIAGEFKDKIVALSNIHGTNNISSVVIAPIYDIFDSSDLSSLEVFTIGFSGKNFTLKASSGNFLSSENSSILSTGTKSNTWDIYQDEDNNFIFRRVSITSYIKINQNGVFAANTNEFGLSIYKMCSSTGLSNSYSRSISNTYATLCLPFPFRLNGSAYSIVGRTSNSIILAEQSVLCAGVPYIVKVDGSVLTASFESNVISAPTSSNGLIGSFIYSDVPEGKYLLSNNTIKRCGTGCSIGEFRAYIDMEQVPTFNQAREKGMIEISGDGVVDFINSINEDSTGSDHIFNLNGVRTNALTRGLNIIKQSNGTVKKLYKK